MPTRNSELLASFTKFCADYPDLRFWQALMAWSGWSVFLMTARPIHVRSDEVMVWRQEEVHDPFRWESGDKYNFRYGKPVGFIEIQKENKNGLD